MDAVGSSADVEVGVRIGAGADVLGLGLCLGPKYDPSSPTCGRLHLDPVGGGGSVVQ